MPAGKGTPSSGNGCGGPFAASTRTSFLASFAKLGLERLPHAVACARYHYLSNRIGSVEVEYIPETDRRAWMRFRHPRWIYDGTALCGVPESVSHGYLRGWYAQNGPSLGNPPQPSARTATDTRAANGMTAARITFR